MDATRLEPENRLLLIRRVWFAFVASPVVLTAALLVKVLGGEHGFVPFGPQARGVFAAVALLVGAASVLPRRRYVRHFDNTHSVSPQPMPDRLASLGRACVVTWALSDAVAIVGFVAAQLFWSVPLFFPYLAAALVLLWLHRPSVWPGWPASAV